MIPFSGIPFLRFIIAFISGIFFYIAIEPKQDYLFVTVAILILYLALYFIQRIRKEYVYILQPYLGIVALVQLFFLGISITYWKDELNHPAHLLHANKGKAYEAIIVSNPEDKPNSYKVELEINKLFLKDTTVETNSRVLLYLSKKNVSSEALAYGDRILVKGWPQEIQEPKNPYEFSYKSRSRYLHIYHQHFIKTSDFYIKERNVGNLFVAFAFNLRKEADAIIHKYIPGEEEQNICSALLLGLKNSLSQELKDVYSSTGTAHALAVSGMHVAVLFQLIMSMLMLIKSAKFKNYILPAILFCVLWIYVFVTGFSPSVLRSGVMFSLILMGGLLGKRSNPYNSVLVSAFALLCFDPFMIMDIGFQLSYLAVIGLIFFTNRIYSCWTINNWLGNAAWKLIAVSIAAQLVTLPLCLFYFHQLPATSLISNLIAVPISSILLYLGVLLLTLFYIPYIPEVMGVIMSWLIKLMNYTLTKISEFDFVSIKSISFSLLQLILLYGILFLITLFILRRKKNYFVFTVVLVTFLLSAILYRTYLIHNQHKLIVYSIKNKKVFAMLSGSKAILAGDSLTEMEYRYHVEPSFIAYGVNQVSSNSTVGLCSSYSQPEYDLFVFHKKSILLTKDSYAVNNIPKVDYIVSTTSMVVELE